MHTYALTLYECREHLKAAGNVAVGASHIRDAAAKEAACLMWQKTMCGRTAIFASQ